MTKDKRYLIFAFEPNMYDPMVQGGMNDLKISTDTIGEGIELIRVMRSKVTREMEVQMYDRIKGKEIDLKKYILQ